MCSNVRTPSLRRPPVYLTSTVTPELTSLIPFHTNEKLRRKKKEFKRKKQTGWKESILKRETRTIEKN